MASHTDSQLFKFGYTFYENGLYNEAEEPWFQVLEVRKKMLGAEHSDTLITMGYLALTYSQQWCEKEAEQLWLQVLELIKRVLRVEH